MHPTTAIRPITSLLIASSMSLAIACSPSGGDKAAPAAAAPAPGGSVAPAAANDAGPVLNIQIEGANANVVSLKSNTFEFGPMKAGGVCGDEPPHELWLLVPKSLDTTTTLQPVQAATQFQSFNVYRLTGLTGSPAVPDTGKPELPPLSAPGTQNQLALVPDLTQFVSSPSLSPSWRDKLSARIVLRGGRLEVKAPEEDPAKTAVWEFKAPGHPATGVSQNITDHLQYTLPLSSGQVTLAFEGGTSMTIEGAPINIGLLTATADAVKNTTSAARYEIGESAHEYCRFYELLAAPPAMSDRALPVLKSVTLTSSGIAEGPRPGKYCGGARFMELP